MTLPCCLGLDIGTSGVKAVLIDDANALIAEVLVPISVRRPHPLWSEQDADDYWRACDEAALALRAKAPQSFQRIKAIGLSGQMHGAVTLGRDDRPLRPVILWNDGRSAAEASAFHQATLGFADRLGVMPMPGLTAPKLLWLRTHEPEIFAKIDCVLLPKDYVRLCLTGERISDMSDAAGTCYFDQDKRDWSDEALAALSLSRDHMPRLVEGSAIGGHLRKEIAERWGLPAGVVVAGGAGDAAAGGIGVGAIEEGHRFISLGTSAQYFVAGRSFRPNVPRLVHAFAHAVPERWYQMGAMLTGASLFGWMAQLLGHSVTALSQALEAQYQGPSSLIMLPYLSGERTPHNDPHAKAAIFGLTSDAPQHILAQAAMEAVAFSLADAAEALAECDDGAPIGLIGGGAQSAVWAQIIASVLNRPIRRYQGGDKGPAFGAALLARMAVDALAPEAVAKAPPERDAFSPNASHHLLYRERLAGYRALYQATKTLAHDLSNP